MWACAIAIVSTLTLLTFALEGVIHQRVAPDDFTHTTLSAGVANAADSKSSADAD